ncbi:MAG TPA: DUF5615 family PIN-like protein [Chloroflexota bacterium]
MLRLLLDEHFSEDDARQLRAHHPTIDVLSIQSWEGGSHLGAPDSLILTDARQQGLTLVTRDLRTIVPLLKDLAHGNTSHGGVIFVDHRAIPEGNTGALIKALLTLCLEAGTADWIDQVVYLRASG